MRKKVNERYAEKKERKRYLPKQEANQELNVRFHQTNDDQKINRYYRNRNGVYNRNTRRGELLTRLTFEIRNVHDEARACMINDCMGNLEGAIRTLAWLRRGHKPEAAIHIILKQFENIKHLPGDSAGTPCLCTHDRGTRGVNAVLLSPCVPFSGCVSPLSASSIEINASGTSYDRDGGLPEKNSVKTIQNESFPSNSFGGEGWICTESS